MITPSFSSHHCPLPSLTQRHERPESINQSCGCPRASARACHNLPQMPYTDRRWTHANFRGLRFCNGQQRAASAGEILAIRIILAMNCAAYTTLCTVASVAYIATRPMHHVSHARGSPCSSLTLVALNPFQASNNSRTSCLAAGASTRLTKSSAMPSSVYNTVANACNFAQNHT